MPINQLIVFDGECLLCNRVVQYILKNDKKGCFYFSTFQGLPAEIDQRHIVHKFKDSISYYNNRIWYQKSTAALLIYRDLHSRLHWTQFFWLSPLFLRDFCYDILAKNRYKWFGKAKSCLLPSAAQQARFIG